jgi:hypothetical protein
MTAADHTRFRPSGILDIAGLAHPAPKCVQGRGGSTTAGRWCGLQKSNHPQLLLLRPRRKWPCHRTAEPRDELSPFYHSIT